MDSTGTIVRIKATAVLLLAAAHFFSSPISAGEKFVSPAARKLAEEKGMDPQQIAGTGKDGRVTKEDVMNWQAPAATPPAPGPVVTAPAQP